jgi:hypothetical protein
MCPSFGGGSGALVAAFLGERLLDCRTARSSISGPRFIRAIWFVTPSDVRQLLADKPGDSTGTALIFKIGFVFVQHTHLGAKLPTAPYRQRIEILIRTDNRDASLLAACNMTAQNRRLALLER